MGSKGLGQSGMELQGIFRDLSNFRLSFWDICPMYCGISMYQAFYIRAALAKEDCCVGSWEEHSHNDGRY